MIGPVIQTFDNTKLITKLCFYSRHIFQAYLARGKPVVVLCKRLCVPWFPGSIEKGTTATIEEVLLGATCIVILLKRTISLKSYPTYRDIRRGRTIRRKGYLTWIVLGLEGFRGISEVGIIVRIPVVSGGTITYGLGGEKIVLFPKDSAFITQ